MSILGSHIGLSAPGYYETAVKTALSYGEDTFMFYTGAPQNSKRKPVGELRIPEGRSLLQKNGIDERKIVVHAPYIINLGNKNNEATYTLGKDFLVEELRRVQAFGLEILVLHPGSHLGFGTEHGLRSLAEALDEVLERDGTNVTIALETMAGKGGEIGVDFAFFDTLFHKVKDSSRLGVCLDTCHVHDAGMDVSDAEALLDAFDATIGLNRLKVVHLNDSKSPRGAHKDRHENLGYGQIGFDALSRFVQSPRLQEIPIILETPYVGEKAPYAKEISLLRKGRFEAGWKEAL